ncbi:hypothetical protein KKJFFJLC_00049 [Vibrio phage vB_VpaS_PGB]|nr:hypothetical protein HHKILHMN_00048 [Vibrio phage vB_VpaS_PGA]WVH05592.1 hypothetical protein KKJFFJLC_00049 [Vibrio phage vB_VpaS_PGB]
MKIGDRVILPKHPQLSGGVITKLHYSKLSGKPWQVTIKLDSQAPIDIAFHTDEVTMLICDVEVIS